MMPLLTCIHHAKVRSLLDISVLSTIFLLRLVRIFILYCLSLCIILVYKKDEEVIIFSFANFGRS